MSNPFVKTLWSPDLVGRGAGSHNKGAQSVKIPAGLLATLLLWPSSAAQAALELSAPYPYPEPAWSPYVVGGLIGILVLSALALAGQKLGASSAYSDTAGMIGRLLAPQHIAALPYYQKKKPRIGWTFTIVLGAILGSFLAAGTGAELTGTYLQDMWVARFGADSGWLRTFVALGGGVLMAFGARMAGGCTSGHGISGTLQLAVSSWIAVICFFSGGIAVAMLLYRV